MDTLGSRIKMLRQQKGISQRKFAKLVGTSPGLVSFIERDRNKPNYEIVGRIAKVLGTSTDYLILGEVNLAEPAAEIIERLKKEIAEESGAGLKVTAKEKELIKRYNVLTRLARLSRTDLEVILEILKRIEQTG
ncbi:hypothetical protein DRQ36_09750 [bacterium]|nr:MAG: hypothetical protein DRQ36_09750 [bacterium]